MRLGLQLGYDDPVGGIALAQEADRLRLPLGLDSGGVRQRCRHAAGLDRREDRAGQRRERHHADAGAFAGDDRDDGDDARSALGGRCCSASAPRDRRSVEGWHGAGIRQAARADPRVRRDRARRSFGARSRWSITACTTTSRIGARRDGLGKPLKRIVAPPAQSPDLPGGDRAEERRAGGRDRRRLAADLLLAGARSEVYAPALEKGFAAGAGGRRIGLAPS